MANGTSVGAIYLDLIVQSTVQAQIEKLMKAAGASVTKSLEPAENAVEKAVTRPMETASKKVTAAFDKTTDNCRQSMDEIAAIANRAAKRYQDSFDSVEVEAPEPEPLNGSALATNLVRDGPQKAMPDVSKTAESFTLAADAAGLLEQKLGVINAQIGEQQSKLQSIVQEYIAVADAKGRGSPEAEKLDSQATAAQSKLISLQDAAIKTQASIDKVAGSAGNSMKKAGDTAGGVGRKITAVFQKTASAVKAPISKIGSAVGGMAKKAVSSVKSMGQGIEKRVHKLSRSFKSAFKSAFLMAGLYAAFRGIRTLIGDAASQNDTFSKSLQAVKSNLLVAFTPIMSAVMPVVTLLTSALASATRKFAEFVTGVFGTTYNAAAASAKKLQDTAKTAKKAAQTIGIDELNIVGQDQDDPKEDIGALQDASAQVDNFDGKLKAAMGNLSTGIGKLLTAGLQKITEAAPAFIAGGFALMGGLITGISDNFPAISDAVLTALSSFAAGVESIAPSVAPLSVNIITLMIKGFLTCVPRLAAAGIQIVAGIFQGMAGTIPQIIPMAQEAITFLLTTVAENLPTILESGMSILLSLAEGIITLIPELVPVVLQIITTLMQGLVAHLPEIVQAGMTLLTSLVGGLSSMLPTLIPLAVQAIMTLVRGLVDSIPQLIDCALDLLIGLADGIIAALPILAEQCPKIIQSLVNGIVDAIPKLIDAAIGIIMGLVGYVIDNLDQIIESSFKIISALVSGLIKAIPELIKAVPKLVSALVDKLMSTDWIQVGKDVITAIIGGISSMGGALWDAFKGLFGGIGDFFGGLFGGGKKASAASVEVPAFASGGIVSSPTLAMIGEYSGARSNPEVVTPLDKLQAMIDGGASPELLLKIIELLERILDLLSDLNLDVKLYADTREIARAAEKGRKQLGYAIIK